MTEKLNDLPTFIRETRSLNSEQRDALNTKTHTVVLAGPGSGKTKTLVLKVAKLLGEIRWPGGVACLTYGREAAAEIERRLSRLGIHAGRRLYAGTVHSFCLGLLRAYALRLDEELRYLAEFEIADEDEIARAVEAGLRRAWVNEPASWWKTKLQAYRRVALLDASRSDEFDARMPAIEAGYVGDLRRLRRIDFDDVVLGTLRAVESDVHVRRVLAARFPWFVIDEYQDLGLPLHRLVQVMMGMSGVCVFAVGDVDQSIFGFQGARPEYLTELGSRPDVVRIQLRINYRSPQEIVDASSHFALPRSVEFKANRADDRGEILFQPCPGGLAAQEEFVARVSAELIRGGLRPGDMTILGARWNDLSGFPEALARANIPHRVVRGDGFKPTTMNVWLMDAMKWCAQPSSARAVRFGDLFHRWQSQNARFGLGRASYGIAERTRLYQALCASRNGKLPVGEWTALMERELTLSGLSARLVASNEGRYEGRELKRMLQVLQAADVAAQEIEEFSGVVRERLVVQSLHSSKGLEFEVVFMVALEEGVLPSWNAQEESRRLFYVGLTRAKSRVYLCWSGYFYTANGQYREKGVSSLVRELWGKLHRGN